MDRDERFWRYVERGDGCWTWTGTRHQHGYGLFWDGKRQVRAHRFAYGLLVGPIPPRLSVLHSCDNPPCVNPAHLRLGTQRENMADMDMRGRRFTPFAGQVQGGSLNRNARLDEPRVAEIKARLAAGEQHAVIAADYGVHRATISQIARGFSWRHVDPHGRPSRARVWPNDTIEAG